MHLIQVKAVPFSVVFGLLAPSPWIRTWSFLLVTSCTRFIPETPPLTHTRKYHCQWYFLVAQLTPDNFNCQCQKESTSETLKNFWRACPQTPCPNDPSALGCCPLPLQVKILLYLCSKATRVQGTGSFAAQTFTTRASGPRDCVKWIRLYCRD